MSDTRSFYDRWARVYDGLARAPVVAGWRRRAVAALDLEPGATAVEMGCGTGANLPYLREAVGPGGRVLGIDLAAGTLRRARDRARRAGRSGISLVRGDAARPPVDGVDGVLVAFVAAILGDPAASVRRWCDAVAGDADGSDPGGRVALLHFRRVEGALASVPSLLYEAFVRLSAPGGRLTTRSLARTHDDAVDRAHAALRERTVDRREERLAGGYVRLVSGRVV